MQPQFDQETQSRIQAARQAGVPEQQILREATAYQQKKSAMQTPAQPAPDKSPLGGITDWLPTIGGVLGGIGGGLLGGPPGAIAGAVAGGASGEGGKQYLRQEPANLPSIALQGGLNGVGEGIGGVVGKVAGRAVGKGGDLLADSAAQGVTKATPSAVFKAIDEHGVNPNDLVAKYAPGASGYDDLLGPTTARNSGGVLGKKLTDAEKVIQNRVSTEGNAVVATPDDLIAPLEQNRQLLSQTVGNEQKISQLDTLINQINTKYKGGLTASQLLDMKRAADQTFGKAVVNDEEGTINSQVQKSIGNTARGILKTKYPDLAGALDTQSEIYTLQPILGKARASNITTGTLGKIDLSRPGSWLTAAKSLVGGEKVNTAALGASQALENANLPGIDIGTVGGAIGAGGASGVGTLVAPDGITQSDNTNPDQGNNQENNNQNFNQGNNQSHSNIIPQDNMSSQLPGITGYNQGQLAKAYTKASLAGDKTNAAIFKQLYDVETAYDKAKNPAANKPLTAQQTKDVIGAQSALRQMDTIDQELAKNPNLIYEAALPGSPNARKYMSAVHEAADIILRLRTGAQANESEINMYMTQFFPQPFDSPETIQYKLQTRKQYLQDIANQGGAGVDASSLPPIDYGATQ